MEDTIWRWQIWGKGPKEHPREEWLSVPHITHSLNNSPGVYEVKEELKKKLEEFSSSSDNLEEVFENREQIEISRYYERLPKPVLIATQEFLEDKVYHRNPLKDNQTV